MARPSSSSYTGVATHSSAKRSGGRTGPASTSNDARSTTSSRLMYCQPTAKAKAAGARTTPPMLGHHSRRISSCEPSGVPVRGKSD
eukprot:scaffold349_cov352-Prasinococcus_capsulatus_cf.AAC.11